MHFARELLARVPQGLLTLTVESAVDPRASDAEEWDQTDKAESFPVLDLFMTHRIRRARGPQASRCATMELPRLRPTSPPVGCCDTYMTTGRIGWPD